MAGRPKKSDNYKMSKGHSAGQKRERGEPIHYDEVKESCNLTITPTAKQMLRELAKVLHISSSEYIERLVRAEYFKQSQQQDTPSTE